MQKTPLKKGDVFNAHLRGSIYKGHVAVGCPCKVTKKPKFNCHGVDAIDTNGNERHFNFISFRIVKILEA